MTVVEVQADPLTLQLPEQIDTNLPYKLVGPNGESWGVVYDVISGSWCYLPY